MRILKLITAAAWLLPGGLTAQQAPVERLRAVLPAAVADRVIQTVSDATNGGLPASVVAERALEAQAKGQSGDEVAKAARDVAQDLETARAALRGVGREADGSEISAAAAVLELGGDGRTIGALAASAPSGRSLAVPLAVLGALINRGLPADDALAAVRQRLAARATNIELVEMPGEAGRLISAGHRPTDVGRMLGAARSAPGAGSALGPPSGMAPHPGGPPAHVPANRGRPVERPQPKGGK